MAIVDIDLVYLLPEELAQYQKSTRAHRNAKEMWQSQGMIPAGPFYEAVANARIQMARYERLVRERKAKTLDNG